VQALGHYLAYGRRGVERLARAARLAVAVRFYSAGEARSRRSGMSWPRHPLTSDSITAIRVHLDPENFTAAWAAGQQLNEERAQADEVAQEALTEAERIRAEAETEVAEARSLAEAAVAAEATAREEVENIRLDAERRVDAAERDAAERIQTVLDEQHRTLAEE